MIFCSNILKAKSHIEYFMLFFFHILMIMLIWSLLKTMITDPGKVKLNLLNKNIFRFLNTGDSF